MIKAVFFRVCNAKKAAYFCSFKEMPMDPIGTILLVDNDPHQNNAMRCEFSWRDYTVLTATSFGEARAMLTKNEPDLILMEAELPDGDGFDFYKEIRSRTSASIVFITVKSDDRDLVRGLKLGVDEYIKKPFNKEVMAARVDAVMKWRKKLGSRIHTVYALVGIGANAS